MSAQYIEALKNRVRVGLREAKDAYRSQQGNSRLASNSGGSAEARYKSMRNDDASRKAQAEADADSAMQELLRYGIETQVMPDGVSVEFHQY